MTDQHLHQLDEGDVSGPPPGTPNVVRITDALAPLYQAAMEKYSHGEKLRFELFMFPLPTEERDDMGNAQIVGMLGLHVEMRGAVLNTQISATRIMQPSGHDEATIDKHARETVEGLLEARTQQLRQQTIDAQAAQERGEAPPANGIIRLGEDPRPNLTFDDMERAVNGWAQGE